MNATVIKHLRNRRLEKVKQDAAVGGLTGDVPLARTQSRVASINESLYRNRTNFLTKTMKKVGFGHKVKVKPEEMTRFNSMQAQRSGMTLQRNPSMMPSAAAAAPPATTATTATP